MLYPRDIVEKIRKVIFREEFIILTGARQTGKTSVLLLLKSFLEKKKEVCFYFNLENPEYLKLLNEHPFKIFELLPEQKNKQYVFVDEAQYLDDPSNFLKLLYDEKRDKIKIIASGSSSFYIDKKFRDSLVGRKFLFEIFSLNFSEFLVFRSQDELLGQKGKKLSLYWKKKLAALWNDYLLFGAYPKVALAENDEMKKMALEEIGTSYVKKDIRDAGIRNNEKYFALLKALAAQTGQLVNSQELARTFSLAHKTVEEYLYVMKKSYQLAFLQPFYGNIRKELVKMPKCYFYDLGLRNFFLDNFDRPEKRSDKGAYAENIVFREILNRGKNTGQIKFWRTQDKKEVNFVAGKEAFEVKASAKKTDWKKYAQFRKQYPGINFQIISEELILKTFYGWKI